MLHCSPTPNFYCPVRSTIRKGLGRLIALDLIGMGDSEKLPNPGVGTYRFITHRNYFWAFTDSIIGPNEPLLFVVHDWGSALAFVEIVLAEMLDVSPES